MSKGNCNSTYAIRGKYNKECLRELTEFLKNHPEMRFIQALWALGIVNNEDRFYEEPEVTLNKIKENK